jgi:hypothetical protein
MALQDVQSCATTALRSFSRRDALPVPRLLNQAQLFGARLLPRRLLARIAGVIYRNALEKAAKMRHSRLVQ